MSGMYKVTASFQNARGEPLCGDEFVAKLIDKDLVVDDDLGTSKLDETGTASFLFSRLDATRLEAKPDLCFTIERNSAEIFRSPVAWDVALDTVDPVTGTPKDRTQHFGPFRVDRA